MKPTRTYDVNGTSDAARLAYLEEHGPPFIFASVEIVKMGKSFSIGGQCFMVTRMTNIDEYFRSHGKLPTFIEDAACFFEATTD